MGDWSARGSPGIAVELKDGVCLVTGRWGSTIEIAPEDMGRLIYLLNLAAEEFEANY